MSAAWGTTGRVTLLGDATEGAHNGETSDLMVDGKKVGWIGAANEYSNWWGVIDGIDSCNLSAPSRDHAVMWVLRRTAPDVWRAERPVVWRVLRAWERFPVARWHVHSHSPVPESRYGCVPEHYDSGGWRQSVDEALWRARHEYEYSRAAR